MKSTILIAFLLLIASMAFGQNMGGMSGGMQAPYTNTYVMPEHPEHASQHSMATEQSLLGNSPVSSAHGERPLSDFGLVTPEVSLGAVARAYRKADGVKTILDK